MTKLHIIQLITGMNNAETRVFEACSMPRNISDISALTSLSRTGISYCLNHLHERGFVRIVRNKRTKSYVAQSLETIADMLQGQLDSIRTGIGRKGTRIQTSKQDEFVIHIGTREIIPAYVRIVTENKNERIKAIQHYRSFNQLMKKITSGGLVAFNKTIIKNHLIIDGILNQSAYNDYKEDVKKDPVKFRAEVESFEGRMADYTVVDDTVFNQDAELWLFKDTSLLINWHDEVAIEITNKSMSAFLRDMFEFVKKAGMKVDHNRAMKGLLGTK